MTIDPEGEAPFKVAIVGAGITGISLAIGLQARNIPFAVYERAQSFREVGAGIGLSENAERAMTAVAPSVREAFEKVAMPNGEDYFQWVDGFNTDRLIFRLHVGDNGFRGCRRSDFLEELIKVLPEGTVKWGKELRSIEEDSPDGRTTLVFKDGTDARADIVVGCDGIRSRVRQLLLGDQDPASYAGYTHKYCFRSLAPMDEALKAIGPYRASTRFMYNGPDAHIITYPVAEGSVLNIVVFVTDTNPWHPNSESESNAENSGNNITTINTGGRNVTHTGKGSREEALSALEGWHPTARAIAGLLPTGDIEKWAVFDMLDHPAGSYTRGTTCLAGDAAHAAGPHLGAGAGFGIEDAVFLATLIAQAADGVKAPGPEGERELGARKNELASEALRVYSDVRYERTQWLIGATRDAVALFQWQKDDRGADHDRFAREITQLFHKIWHYDLDLEVKQARAKLAGRFI